MGTPSASDSSGLARFRFPSHLRLKRRPEFQQVMKSGARLLDQRIVLWGLANGRDYSRLGLTVSRKHGPAVRRNRLKRLLREAFRLTQAQLPPGLDLVCAPRIEGEASLAGYQESLARLAARLARRLAQG